MNIYLTYNGHCVDKVYRKKASAIGRVSKQRNKNRHVPPTHYWWEEKELINHASRAYNNNKI